MHRGPGVTAEATRWLFERGIRVMGIDAWGWDRPLRLQAADAIARDEPGLFWEAHQVDLPYSQIERLVNLARAAADRLPGGLPPAAPAARERRPGARRGTRRVAAPRRSGAAVGTGPRARGGRRDHRRRECVLAPWSDERDRRAQLGQVVAGVEAGEDQGDRARVVADEASDRAVDVARDRRIEDLAVLSAPALPERRRRTAVDEAVALGVVEELAERRRDARPEPADEARVERLMGRAQAMAILGPLVVVHLRHEALELGEVRGAEQRHGCRAAIASSAMRMT